MKKTKWALIGCGKVVLKNKTSAFINSTNTIVGICTTNTNHSKIAKNKLNLKKCGCYENVGEMLKNENIDALYICTPPKSHYTYLKTLAKYNLPIYVEKPFVLNKKEAEDIVKLYKKNNIPLFVAHYKRLTPKIKKLKSLLEKQKIGKIISIKGIFNRKFNNNLLKNSWIYNKDISGGGRFFDIAPHIFDIIYYFFGEFKNIHSIVEFETKKHNCENLVNVDFKIKDINCKLFFDLVAEEDKDVIYFYGTKGYIKTSINRDMPIYIYNKKEKIKRTFKFKKIKTWGIETIKEFNKFINKKNYTTNLCTGEQALKIQTYIDKSLKK